jgi:hypothetical protein
MEENQGKVYWVLWYPSYTHKDFELINKDNGQFIIEDLTDRYYSDKHTYLKIGTTPPDTTEKKENIQLSFYEITRKKSMLLKFVVWLFRNGFIKDRPIQTKPIDESLLTDDKLIAKIDLKYKNHSPNGLFVYECIADENYKKFSSADKTTLSDDKDQFPIFYCVKQLYHTHLFHKKTKQYKDYYFRAFLTKSELNINITDKNNDSIVFYLTKILEYFELQLKHFEEIKTSTNADINTKKKKIKNSIDTLSEFIKDIDGTLQTDILESDRQLLLFQKKIYEKTILKRNKDREFFITLSENKKDKRKLFVTSNNIVGETLFTNTLCHSKYLDRDVKNDNEIYSDTEKAKNRKRNEIRKLLLNIDNVRTGLYYIRDSYRYWYDRHESKKSKFFGYVGYFVGILGIAFTIFTFYKADKSLQEQQEKIENLFRKQNDFINNTMNNSYKKDTVSVDASEPVWNASTQPSSPR